MNAQLPLISITPPCFNALPLPVENIDRVRVQDYYPATDRIVWDGKSTDGTASVTH